MIDLSTLRRAFTGFDFGDTAGTYLKRAWLRETTRDHFEGAKQAEKLAQAQAREALMRKVNDTVSEQLGALVAKVRESALPLKQNAQRELGDTAASGKGAKAVWDLVVSKQIKESFYFPDLPFANDAHGGGDAGRNAGKVLVNYLENEQPELWKKLYELFKLCEQNDIAIQFSFPEKSEEVPAAYGDLSGKHSFSKIDIVVSPFDTHYKPLTVGRMEIPQEGGAMTSKSEQFRDYNFSLYVLTSLHPETGIERLFTGRHYRA